MNHLILISIIFLLSGKAFAQSIYDGVLLHYKMDGSALDYSGNGFNGMLNGATPVNDSQGNANAAFYFDGVDDYIDFPNDPSLKPPLPITVSYMVKFDFIDQVGTQMFTTDFEQNNYNGVWTNLSSDGQGRIGLAFGGGVGGMGSGNRRTKLSTDRVAPQKWYRLTFVVRSEDDMEIYIDCVDAGGTYTGNGPTTISYSNVSGSIGRVDAHTGLPAYYFSGALDDFIYWNRALSESEVVSLCDGILAVEDEPEQVSANSIIYPNPFSGFCTVRAENVHNERMFVEFVDLQGRTLLTTDAFTGNEISIDGTPLSSGIYIYKVRMSETAELASMGRVVVQ